MEKKKTFIFSPAITSDDTWDGAGGAGVIQKDINHYIV